MKGGQSDLVRCVCAALLAIGLVGVASARAAEPGRERLSNDKVVVSEVRLEPGKELMVRGDRASATIHLEAGTLEFHPNKGPAIRIFTERGNATFDPAQAGVLRNVGRTSVAFIRIEFIGSGSQETWASKGLAPADKLLFENAHARAYAIRLAAGASEPEKSLNRRVVVYLSGAKLTYRLPDGRQETAHVRPGEIAWREPATRAGHNVGRTEFWAIAVEPK